VHGLNNNKNYTIDYYKTRGNGGQFSSLTKRSNIFGTLKPNWIGNDPDIAFRAYRSGHNFRETNEIMSDTLFCWEDTVSANGNHENDSLGNFHYHWIFGNGQQSFNRNDIVVYDKPGTYMVTLIISDSLGWSDTLKEYIVKLGPCIALRSSALNNELVLRSSWNVFPNPSSSILSITFDSSWTSIISVELYAIDGRCVKEQTISSSDDKPLPIPDLPSGLYMLRVSDGKRSDTKRIIIVH
jgi:hypothetical protein